MHPTEHSGANQGLWVSNHSPSAHSSCDYSLAPVGALDCLSSTLLSSGNSTPSLGELPLPCCSQGSWGVTTIGPCWPHGWACDLSRANQKPALGFLHLQPERSSRPVVEGRQQSEKGSAERSEGSWLRSRPSSNNL